MKASHPFFINDSKAEVILNQIFTVPCMWCPGLNIRVDVEQIHWLSMSYHTLEEMFNTKGMTATYGVPGVYFVGTAQREMRGKNSKGEGKGVSMFFYHNALNRLATVQTASWSSGGSPHRLKGEKVKETSMPRRLLIDRQQEKRGTIFIYSMTTIV